LYAVIQFSMSRRALARSGQESAPISVLIVAKNDSAAAPSRQEPVRLVLCLLGLFIRVVPLAWPVSGRVLMVRRLVRIR
jgi:hypothetical protein